MLLGNPAIVNLTKILESGTAQSIDEVLKGQNFTLATALWYTLCLNRLRMKQVTDGKEEMPSFASYSFVEEYYNLGSTLNADREFTHTSYGVWPILSKDDVVRDEWLRFLDRFRICASNESKGKVVKALARTLWEMADNVPWHAFLEGAPCSALAGYHVRDGVLTFSVADVGMGFLASLKKLPHWKSLQREQDALQAVIDKEATSRPGETSGGGYKQLFQSLVDLNGLVYLRSGNSVVEIKQRGKERMRHFFPKAGGFGSQITVVVSFRGVPAETALEIC
ncbi:hypothetical protein DB346_22570 [Verrucomicrobia bacterium LW23]|nr:hypothetical protein DB346_22570 [Verrucomicrobia bacterium LW23]